MRIFVFGSNLAGVHGGGAARFAFDNYGAVYGQGIGLQGNSYAIPTKDERISTLPLSRIKKYVDDFLDFAKSHPEMEFDLTPIGCGLAGYKRSQIRPLFGELPQNVHLTDSWNDEDFERYAL